MHMVPGAEASGRPGRAYPIGRAIDGVEVFAVTEDGHRAEPGEVGELYVRGPSVTPGYWGDPERTAEAVVASPVGRSGETAYRTGDLVEELTDGTYRFLGRRDAQIKSRGHRIELGEIETAIWPIPVSSSARSLPSPTRR